MNQTIRWGILSTGKIAHKFANGLSMLPDAELVAVGSRNLPSAQQFAEDFNVPHAHASYEALVENPEVDVVYIGTPHAFHKDNMLLCLQAGKPVLCEKPFTINAAQADEVVEAAKARGLFVMEAMWMRFIPAIVKLRQWLDEKIIGEVKLISADFGFRPDFDPHSRLFDPALGGGSLLDLGIYPVSLCSMILGTPQHISGLAHLGSTGVDEQASVVFGYDQGRVGSFYTSFQAKTPGEATIMGTQGRIRLHHPFHHPSALTLSLEGKKEQIIEVACEGNGYHYQAAEVMACLRAGKTESDTMPLAETVSIMQTLDQIRAQWAFKYPME